MITPDGWLDWAERQPGPADKKYSEPNRAGRYIPHSAVGYYAGWSSRLFSTQRDPDDPSRYSDYAAVSVHGWIAYDGHVVEHYPFTVSCWASGNREANTNGIAIENEGGLNPYSEPLTEPQVQANVRIIEELSAWKGWVPARPVGLAPATLLEHQECVRLWGGHATACPSQRIPWAKILALLGPLGGLTVSQYDELRALIQENARQDALRNTDTLNLLRAALTNLSDTDTAIRAWIWSHAADHPSDGPDGDVAAQVREIDAKLKAAAEALAGP